MAEFTGAAPQTVASGGFVVFQNVAAQPNRCISHRDLSGLVALRGITNQRKARYRVSYGGNIAIPAGGTVEAITAALSINGEPLDTSLATVTPAAVENYFNIYVSAMVDVPCGCCVHVGVKNTSTQPILFANSNLEVVRTA